MVLALQQAGFWAAVGRDGKDWEDSDISHRQLLDTAAQRMIQDRVGEDLQTAVQWADDARSAWNILHMISAPSGAQVHFSNDTHTLPTSTSAPTALQQPNAVAGLLIDRIAARSMVYEHATASHDMSPARALAPPTVNARPTISQPPMHIPRYRMLCSIASSDSGKSSPAASQHFEFVSTLPAVQHSTRHGTHPISSSIRFPVRTSLCYLLWTETVYAFDPWFIKSSKHVVWPTYMATFGSALRSPIWFSAQ